MFEPILVSYALLFDGLVGKRGCWPSKESNLPIMHFHSACELSEKRARANQQENVATKIESNSIGVHKKHGSHTSIADTGNIALLLDAPGLFHYPVHSSVSPFTLWATNEAILLLRAPMQTWIIRHFLL